MNFPLCKQTGRYLKNLFFIQNTQEFVVVFEIGRSQLALPPFVNHGLYLGLFANCGWNKPE